MADETLVSSHSPARGRRLERILNRANSQLRVVLERLERELKSNGLQEALPSGREATVARVVLSASATYVITRLSNDILKDLSPRQLQIADLILLHRTTQKEAARKLGISPRTLSTHLERVYAKCREVSLESLLRQLSLMI